MSADSHSIRHVLHQRHDAIAGAHRAGATGAETCVALTAAMDDAVRSMYALVSGGVRNDIAVFALGGYGRSELCPHSDVDVMVLCPAEAARDAAGEAAKSFLHHLWDAGVTIGHSVRTTEEAMQTYGATIDAWASMIESRFLCGNETLAADFYAALETAVASRNDRWFSDGVFDEVRIRHQKNGNSVKLLEPNIKKSSGGLRDIHTALWLYRASDPSHLKVHANGILTVGFLDRLLHDAVIDSGVHAAARAAYEFLLRTRHAMHYRRNSLHDTLEYALQVDVAEDLGYGSKAELRSVEVFMREYYLHARTIHRLHQRLVGDFRDPSEGGGSMGGSWEPVGKELRSRGEILGISPGVERLESAGSLFAAFVHTAEHDCEMDFRLRLAIERSADLITAENSSDQTLAAQFRRILNSRRVARTLGDMNELGILGRYIPEFGDLIAFFQHNVYHYFTADEHTLVAVANVERLRDQQGVLREVFRNLKRKDTLFLTVLLHDIGKPRGVADHEITGVDMAALILRRLGLTEIASDVGFLIRNHLMMEQVAFRRNIHDPDTIREFAARFPCAELLDYLYLLTYADLSAVNVNVWTEWKASMLQDLYMRASEVLRRDLKGEQVDAYHQSRRAEAESNVVETLSAYFPREKVERHLQGIQSEGYTAIFTEEEIRRHIDKSEAPDSVSTLFVHSKGYTEITIISRDAPFALSKFCAVLAANDANIFDANIFTRDDGVIIDRFRVSDASARQELDPRVSRKIADDLVQVMEGTLDVAHLFEAHHRRWKRRQKLPTNPTVRIGVEFEDNPRFTIVDVYAPDAVGFLYKITETISRLALDIYFAKIATRVDGIVDAFYVLDRTGKPVTDPVWRSQITKEILDVIRSLQEQELE